MTVLYNKITLPLALTALLLGAAPAVSALPADTYAASSRLADGYWVKVSVSSSGMCLLSDAELRRWGFNNPADVKVYGYGAMRLPERLDNTYLDDLPQTPSEYVAGRGIVFYAQGPVSVGGESTLYLSPVNNPFTTEGYYFLSANSYERVSPLPVDNCQPSAVNPVTSTRALAYHELEAASPGQVGHLLLGEDFKYNRQQTFRIDLPGADLSSPVRMEASFMAHTVGALSEITYTVDGTQLPFVAGDRIQVTTDSYSYGREGLAQRTFNASSQSVNVGVNYSCAGTVSMANFNYIALTYVRPLTLEGNGGTLLILEQPQTRGFALAGADSETRVWDITDSWKPRAMRLSEPASGVVTWSCPRNSDRRLMAWKSSADFLSAKYIGTVRPQNLHAQTDPVDMVIFTPPQWKDQARRLARFHEQDTLQPLAVRVLTPDEIYNEFSSGAPDVQAFRKYLKMLYDRQASSDRPLRYALFMSRPTFDNRRLTTEGKGLGYPTLPAWFTDRGLHQNDSYTTDDIFGFLADNSGVNTGADKLSIAVGRIPCTSAEHASSIIDKLERYYAKMPMTNWRNNFLVTCDDQDGGDHMNHGERFSYFLQRGDGASSALLKKLYIDQYPLVSNVTEEGRKILYRNFDEGVMWWVYTGHASTTALTAESLVTYNDLNNLYLRHFPVIYGATCHFLRWDSPQLSGAEILYNNPNGGVVAAISATRPVYIPNNGNLTAAFGRHVLERDSHGLFNTIGEIYRNAKNDYRHISDWDSNKMGVPASDTNKLRYVLMGDPAMRLAIPSMQVKLDKIAGVDVPTPDEADMPVLMARQQVTVEGHVASPDGTPLTDFNGVLIATMYDAEESITTLGHGDDGVPFSFDQPQGGRLFVGNTTVKGGKFTLPVSMPSEVADNFRPAALDLFAYEENGRQAVSVSHDFYVYGTDTEALPDTVPPVIDAFYLNHPTFQSGDEVNNSPVIIAEFTDDRAINLSTAGIGHQIALYLDNGTRSFADLADYYTPFTDGRIGGRVVYPLENLAVGAHTLRLRVWDTAPNSTEANLDFFVAKSIAPTIYDIYTDCNPASTAANFYVSHDRPDRDVTVTIEVFDLMGRRVWSATQNGRSDMFESLPVTWDLTDYGGRRVARGIYVYRATISDNASGEKTATESKRLAVTGI